MKVGVIEAVIAAVGLVFSGVASASAVTYAFVNEGVFEHDSSRVKFVGETVPGAYSESRQPSKDKIANGYYTSYFLAADATGTGSPHSDTKTYTFSNDIVAVVWNRVLLSQLDAEIGPHLYSGQNRHGLEGLDLSHHGTGLGNIQNDAFTFGADGLARNQIRVDYNRFDLNVDALRVLTSPVPLPPALLLFGSALVGVLVVPRRRKSQHQQGSTAVTA